MNANQATVQFGERTIGDGQPCYVIAEAGANHNGDYNVACELIDVAVEAGADAVKFQTYSGNTLYSSKAPKFDYLEGISDKAPHELLEEIAMPRHWQPLLADYCGDRIDFLSSPFDRQAVDELDELNVNGFKIASFELVDLPFIEYAASKGRPLILSTGMATLGEVEEAIAAANRGGTDDILVLQCASLYPSPPSIMNLRSIPALRQAFGRPTGLSDHTLGIHISVSSVALGAALIEKHFTLDRSMEGPDHAFAVEPTELGDLVRQVRDVESALGDGVKRGPTEAEAEEMYGKARRSVVAAEPISAGSVVERRHLTVKRPGHGIKPKFIEAIVGRTARTDIDYDDIITWDMV